MPTYKVNRRAVQRARELIAAHRYVLRSDWGLRQPRADDENRYLNGHSWDEYGSWHLGLTDGAPDDTKGRYAFVFGDLRRIHRSGIIASYYRAAEWGHTEVYIAAHNLLRLLDREAGFRARARARPRGSRGSRSRGSRGSRPAPRAPAPARSASG